MNHTVYFADKSVIFTSDAPGGECYAVVPADPADLSRAKVTKILESHNCVAVVSADPDAAFRSFAADFTQIEAAGGVVVNDRGEWLMMRRNGRWDLPKGHRRTGAAAVPDVARLLFPEDRALGAETHPLVRTARGGLRRPRTADRRGDRDGRLVHSGRSDGPCRREFPHGASRARTTRSLLV